MENLQCRDIRYLRGEYTAVHVRAAFNIQLRDLLFIHVSEALLREQRESPWERRNSRKSRYSLTCRSRKLKKKRIETRFS